MDANVLIDFCEADRALLRLVSTHVGAVHVPLPILMAVGRFIPWAGAIADVLVSAATEMLAWYRDETSFEEAVRRKALLAPAPIPVPA